MRNWEPDFPRKLTHNERVLNLLSDGEPHGHMEGYRLGVMLHSRVADLRKQGHDIKCWRDGDSYFYRLSLHEPAERPEKDSAGSWSEPGLTASGAGSSTTSPHAGGNSPEGPPAPLPGQLTIEEAAA